MTHLPTPVNPPHLRHSRTEIKQEETDAIHAVVGSEEPAHGAGSLSSTEVAALAGEDEHLRVERGQRLLALERGRGQLGLTAR